MPTFGRTAIGGAFYWVYPDQKEAAYGSRFRLTERGRVTKISCYCRANTGTVNARCGIYEKINGVASAVLKPQTEALVVTTVLRWWDFTLTPIILRAGDYVLVIQCGPATDHLNVLGGGDLGNDLEHRVPDTWTDGLENPFGSGGSHIANTSFMINATYDYQFGARQPSRRIGLRTI